MLQSISWQQYFVCIIIATLLYYLFVWIVIFQGKFSFLPAISNLRQATLHGEDSPDEVLSTAQHIIDELRPLFAERTNKQELLFALQSKLKRYAEWDEPGFRKVINEFILKESEIKCSIRLGEEDQRALWV